MGYEGIVPAPDCALDPVIDGACLRPEGIYDNRTGHMFPYMEDQPLYRICWTSATDLDHRTSGVVSVRPSCPAWTGLVLCPR
jgi:hypothetical protein